MNLPNKLSQAASDQFHELKLIQALDHIDNLLDCINDARMSTIPPITDGEELTTISFGYTKKIRAANHFLKQLKYGVEG